jgi:hypothetical protein
MPFESRAGLRFYTFEIFDGHPISHAVFTRQGGVSPAPWTSLNMSFSVGDSNANMQHNKKLAFEAVGRDLTGFGDSWLVHGKEVLIYERPTPPDTVNQNKADILLTDHPDVTLFMRYADCVPLFFYDPGHHAIALAHAGWKGTVLKVGQETVSAMRERYGSDPAQILAAIGPSISAERYPVGQNVIDEVEAAFDGSSSELLPKFGDNTHFDLWKANLLTLQESGVRDVELAGLCTASNPEDWYSHRGEGGRTGRFGALVGLNAI